MKRVPPTAQRIRIVFLILIFTAAPLFAEGSNPFQGNDSDEDIFDTPDNLGFEPPAGVNQTPPTPRATPPSQNTPSASPPSRSAPPIPRAGQNPPNTIGTKEAPKLADYLELDPSVRSLEVKNFDMIDKDIKDVVTLISKWTGKNFILDSNKVRGKITILGPSQVTLQEAYSAFLSALAANGLTTVQSGKFIRIIEQREARRAPVKTYVGDYAPHDDNFITRIFQLKYINADEVQREFRDMVTQQGKLFAYNPTNTVIITDTGSNIQRIKHILESLDVKTFETTLHVLPIKYGSAKAIAQMLTDMYGDTGTTGRTARPASTFRRSALERTRGGGQISKIVPDEATNSLVVLANSEGLRTLRQLVNKLDIKISDSGKINVYYCEYAKAEDLAATLSALAGGGGTTPRPSARTTTPSTRNQRGGIARTTGRTTSGASVTSADLGDGVRITADASTNSLVIIANASDYNTVKRVIKKLDIPRLQVFVETAILEVAIEGADTYGTSAAVAGHPDRATMGGFIANKDDVLGFITGSPATGTTIPIFLGPKYNPPGLNASTSGFMGILTFLTQNTNTSILSTPQILALDNEEAQFKVLDRTPVQSDFTPLSSGATGGSGLDLSQLATGRIEHQETGIDIKLTPHVNRASRTIRMDIQQKVDTVRPTNKVPPALQNIQQATTSRETNTSVVVRDLHYVMLGGLMSDKIDETTTKVPLLGDIPILGWLFKRRTEEVIKTNLIILLRPRIIDTNVAETDVIKERFKHRKGFIEKEFGGDDFHKDKVSEMESHIEDQAKGRLGRGQKFPQYKSGDIEQEELLEVPPGQESNILPKGARTEESFFDEPAEPSASAPKDSAAPRKTAPDAAAPLLEDVPFEDALDNDAEAPPGIDEDGE